MAVSVIARSEIPRSAIKQSHWWDRPARNAGLPAIRHPGLRSGVQEMAGRDARRYQIVGTGVPAGADFPVGQASCVSIEDGQDAHPNGDCSTSLAMKTLPVDTECIRRQV
jgi:hypothetical protein